jgi:hypothetical protein
VPERHHDGVVTVYEIRLRAHADRSTSPENEAMYLRLFG